ncbi:MAG: SDR family NAD(P)-dependent oxidoreductase [Alphaproteobacteria bacterium]|nr:SDR family NAD(P)-dependent oxidoreductase [Alphaproteobacteria bacterium]
MDIKGCTALVTGANRGLGKAYVEALFAAGASKVYAGARDPGSVADSRAVPVKLDVTSPADVTLAATEHCRDVNLLINNAGIMLASPMLQPHSEEALRQEMEVNVFGMQRMIRAFSPVLARNGGGAIANMLSVVSWFVNPINATYCASKHAAKAVSDAARMELKAQGTHVVSIYAGYIDTDMVGSLDVKKTSPRQVAERTLEGIRTNANHVRADDRADMIWNATRTDPDQLEAQMQAQWDSQSR